MVNVDGGDSRLVNVFFPPGGKKGQAERKPSAGGRGGEQGIVEAQVKKVEGDVVSNMFLAAYAYAKAQAVDAQLLNAVISIKLWIEGEDCSLSAVFRAKDFFTHFSDYFHSDRRRGDGRSAGNMPRLLLIFVQSSPKLHTGNSIGHPLREATELATRQAAVAARQSGQALAQLRPVVVCKPATVENFQITMNTCAAGGTFEEFPQVLTMAGGVRIPSACCAKWSWTRACAR